MLSKLYRPLCVPLQVTPQTLGLPKARLSQSLLSAPVALRVPLRQLSLRFPKQYQQPVSNKFRLFHVLRHHWELSPLLLAVTTKILLVSGAIYAGIYHRMDTQFTQRNWNCISRNMDLRNPTIHKHLTINQKYEPWPELQDVLDKMAEKEAGEGFCECGLGSCRD